MDGDNRDCTRPEGTLRMCKKGWLRRYQLYKIMIEAGAILFVVVVSLAIYLSSWIASREFSKANASNQLDVLIQHRETLRQKVIRGEQECWDSEMMRQLAYRVEQVEQEIGQKTAAR